MRDESRVYCHQAAISTPVCYVWIFGDRASLWIDAPVKGVQRLIVHITLMRPALWRLIGYQRNDPSRWTSRQGAELVIYVASSGPSQTIATRQLVHSSGSQYRPG